MGSRHWKIDGTPEFDRACAAAERAQALAEQAYVARSKLLYAQIAQSFDLWTDHVDPLGTMTRDEFDVMPLAGRIALIETIFGPEQQSPETYTLSAIGLERTYTGPLAGAIELARQIDAEYQRAYGVTITDIDGHTICTVDDGVIEW